MERSGFFGISGLVRRGRLWWTCLAGLVALLLPAVGTAGDITGRLTDAATGQPVEGYVYAYTTAGASVQTSTFAPSSTGTYTLTGLAAGSYILKAQTFSGHIEQLHPSTQCAPCTIATAGATPVDVPATGTVSGIDFSLQKGGRIAGRITDSVTGSPLVSKQLSFYTATGVWVGYAHTDSGGNYTSNEGFFTGSYRVVFFNDGQYLGRIHNAVDCPTSCSTSAISSGTAVAVTLPATTPGIDIAIKKGGVVSGSVTSSSTSLPVSGVSVRVYNSSGSQVTSATSSAAGAWTGISALPTGTYYARTFNSAGYINEVYNNTNCLGCSVTSGAAISITEGSTTSGINFALAPGGRVSGTITNESSGQPISGGEVDIYTSSGVYTGTFVLSGADGTYLTGEGLPAGNYYAKTFNSSGYINEVYDNVQCLNCSATLGAPIALTDGSTKTGINFALAVGARMSGTVTDSSNGGPLASASVFIYTAAGSYTGSSALSGSNGTYISGSGLPSGTYYAYSSKSSTGHISEVYNDIGCFSCVPTQGAPISLTVGATTPGIDFSLAPGGAISGTVTAAATGLPISGITVLLYDALGSQIDSATTGSTGSWGFDSLLTGAYFVRTSNSSGYVNAIYNNVANTASILTGSRINVTAGSATTGINFALATGGVISGTITATTGGLPISGVTVSVYDSNNVFVTSVTSNASGVWTTTTGLATGNYYVRTSNSAGYINEIYNNVPSPGSSFSTATLSAGSPVSVTAGSTTTGINFALDSGGVITGTVTSSATSLPISGVTVTVYNSLGTQVTFATTNSSGVWTTTSGLASGSYFIRATNFTGYINELYNNIPSLGPLSVPALLGSASVSVTSGATTSGIDFALDPGGRIGGTVTSATSGLPLNGVSVTIYDASGAAFANTTTSATGAWLIGTGLPTGTYYAVTTSNGSGHINQAYSGIECASCLPTASTAIGIVAGVTRSGIDFQLVRGGRIAGKVTDPVSGAAIPSVGIQVYTAGGSAAAATGSTDANGDYLLEDGLPSGTYRVGFFATNRITTAYDGIVCHNCAIAESTGVVVTSPKTTFGVNAQMAVGGGIRGTVKASSVPISGASVVFYDSTGRRVAVSTTDVLGGYSRTGLPAGTYFMEALAAGYNRQVYNAVCSTCAATSGTAVVVTGTATSAGIDFNLAVGASRPGLNTTAAILGLTRTGVTLRAQIDPNGLSTSAVIEYGPTTAYGQMTGALSAGSGDGFVNRDFALAGLVCGTTYHSRIVATNSAGSTASRDDVFITPACILPTLTINDARVTEGNAGTVNATFTVTLSTVSGQAVTVSAGTSAGTASAGTDYTSPGSTTLTIPAGATTTTFSVPVVGDTVAESNEAFGVVLSNPVGATLARAIGQGTIVDDDRIATTTAPARPQGAWQEFFAVDTLETPYVGDFNGDGKVDIITFTRQNPNAIGDVYVSLSNGVTFGANTKWHDFFAITTDETVVIGDYDGDGKDDIATWLGKASRQVYVALSTGSGMTPEVVWVNSIGSQPTDYLASGDANGDGKDDLIMFARTEGKVYVAISNGSKFATPVVWHPFFAVSTYERPRVADVNGDGRADIVTFATDSPSAFGDVYTALSNGTAFRAADGSANSDKWHDFFAIRPTEEIRIGDLNGDGKDDFFTFLPPPFAQCYSVLSQGTSMAGNVLWAEAVAPLLGAGDNVYVGDVNGDGKSDIVIFAQKEGKVFISLAP